jgi:hypothetical protein
MYDMPKEEDKMRWQDAMLKLHHFQQPVSFPSHREEAQSAERVCVSMGKNYPWIEC